MKQIMKLHQSTVEETMPKSNTDILRESFFDGTEETQDNRPRRYYVRVSDFVLARVIKALKDPTLQQGFEIICKNLTELEKENSLVKSLLYCSKKSCDNCGFVTCENFQRQRKSEPCALYISYQDRIKNLAHENDVLMESLNNSE